MDMGYGKSWNRYSGEEDNEELVNKKSESGNVGSPVDEKKWSR
jgi:hypothetical protein